MDESSASTPRLLIVDDEVPQMQALCITLQDEGYATRGFTSPHEALAVLRAEHFDVMLTDLMMPGMDGLSLLRAALDCDPDLVVILMTGHGTIDTAVAAMKAGALDYILKPFKLSAIAPVLERALALRRLRRENATLSRRVAERTAELEAANRELDAFSHSVSHDLRAPLRHIEGYAGMLLKNFSSDLPSEAQRYVNVMVEGAQRMEQLIEDLLRFSRLGRQPISRKSVDLAALAGTILDDFRRQNPQRKVDVTVGHLPACSGDPSLLRQVMENLISNAFKYTGKKEQAVLEIGCREDDNRKEADGPVYFVRDNGAGFDMQYADRLFGVFQRLHNSREFAGTGVGLSLVQRIIRRHGGRIWAEAALDQGATFYFTVPPAHPSA